MSDLTGSAQPPHPLRELIWPVYVPSVIYASGTSALLPAQIVVALQLGFDAAQVALLATWVGAFAVLASFVSGYLIAWWGERRALGVSTVATSAVSYTHLDVYKRQHPHRPRRPQGRSGRPRRHQRRTPCLLYTSRCV